MLLTRDTQASSRTSQCPKCGSLQMGTAPVVPAVWPDGNESEWLGEPYPFAGGRLSLSGACADSCLKIGVTMVSAIG